MKAWTKDWKTLQGTADKDRNRCSMSLAIREMQSKSTMSYHYIPTRMSKNIVVTASNDVGQLEPIYMATGNEH